MTTHTLSRLLTLSIIRTVVVGVVNEGN